MFSLKNNYDLRCDPDGRYAEQRKAGPMIPSRMTDEDIAKYGPPSNKKNSPISRVPGMIRKETKATRDEFKYGTDLAACKKIKEIYGYTQTDNVRARMREYGLVEVG
jgi:hypothetical protein